MRISDDLLDTVVFVGAFDGNTFSAVGTAFVLKYDGQAYLITARHVAEVFEDGPFFVRVNTKEGGVDHLHVDQHIAVRWSYHPDDSVDVAAFLLPKEFVSMDIKSLSTEMFLDNGSPPGGTTGIGVGDTCYTVGLFRLMVGEKRNLPVVHTGSIARVPSEKIPTKIGGVTRLIDAYIVQQQALTGLSGSPVFVRYTYVQMAAGAVRYTTLSNDVKVLGIWQGSWKYQPDEILIVEAGNEVTVPVGMGLVVPAEMIIETLDSGLLKEYREISKAIWNTTSSVKNDDV